MAKQKSISVQSIFDDIDKLSLEEKITLFKVFQTNLQATLTSHKQKISEAEDAIDKLSEVIEVKQ